MGKIGCSRNLEKSLLLINTWTALWETLFPRTCPVCGRQLIPCETDLCLICERDLPLTHFWDWRNNPAEQRLTDRIAIDTVCSLFYFDKTGSYPALVHRIKYQVGRKLGRLMGQRLGKQLLPLAAEKGWTGIVPVPLHWFRQWSRGYNQAEWIAKGIADMLQLPLYPNLLQRQRYTRTQTQLDAEARRTNLQNAFRLNPTIIPATDQHWLLVDDVLTTGATLEACINALQSVPSVRVSVATLGFAGDL